MYTEKNYQKHAGRQGRVAGVAFDNTLKFPLEVHSTSTSMHSSAKA